MLRSLLQATWLLTLTSACIEPIMLDSGLTFDAAAEDAISVDGTTLSIQDNRHGPNKILMMLSRHPFQTRCHWMLAICLRQRTRVRPT